MTIEFDFTEEDLLAFNLYHFRTSPTSRRHYFQCWFILPVIALALCIACFVPYAGGTSSTLHPAVLPLFVFAMAYLALFPWTYRRRLRKTVTSMAREGRNAGLFGRHHVTLSPEGISVNMGSTQTSTMWKSVERVVTTDQYVFIYVNALAAVVVPRRAFADSAHFDTFVQTAVGYHSESQA